MKRALGVAIAIAITATLASGVATEAAAATPSWLHVRTATHATAYNGGAATVKPSATVSGRRLITSKRVTVYRAGRRYRSGTAVRLHPGNYTTVTSGHYKLYKLVRQRRTRSVLHEGDLVNATCKVTRADDLGDGSTESTATCTNSYYPRQRPTDVEVESYQVGAIYRTSIWFEDEYVSQTYYASVRKYGVSRSFSSSHRNLRIVDGGFRRIFRGSGEYTSYNFRPPTSTWRVNYTWDCSDFGYAGNMIVWIYRSNGDIEDLAANELGYSGSGHTYVHAGGRFYLDISSECSWVVTVRG